MGSCPHSYEKLLLVNGVYIKKKTIDAYITTVMLWCNPWTYLQVRGECQIAHLLRLRHMRDPRAPQAHGPA